MLMANPLLEIRAESKPVQAATESAAPPSHSVPPPVARITTESSTIAASPSPSPKAEAATPPVFNAAYLGNTEAKYPLSARRNGDEGKVMLLVKVSAEGVPVKVDVLQSSGFPALDRAALDAVRAWRFVPARQSGKAVEGEVRVPVVFQLGERG